MPMEYLDLALRDKKSLKNHLGFLLLKGLRKPNKITGGYPDGKKTKEE
jgi:hypothetical protein